MNTIDQNPKLSLTDLWGPLWNPMQWACFADEGGDGTGTGGGDGDAGGNYDENGDEKEDTEDSAAQSDETQEEKDAKAEQEKQDDAVVKEAVDISKTFDEKLDAENDLDDDETPSGDDKKGDEKDDDKAAQTGADDKNSSADEEKDDSETDDKVITDDLQERAVKAGYNLTEAKSFSSAKALEKTLEILEKSQASAGDQTSDDKTGKADTENKDADDKKIEFKPFEVKPFEVKFEDDGDNAIDPEIAKNIKAVNEQANSQMKAMNEHYSEQFKNMAEQLQNATTQLKGFQNTTNQQGAAKFEAEFESLVAGLGNEYKDLVGKGVGADLNKDGSELANRNKLIVAMRTIDTATLNAKQELLPQKEVFNQALAMVFSDKTKELATKKVAAKIEARGKQGINRASGAKGKPLTPHEGAVQASKDFDSKLDAAEG